MVFKIFHKHSEQFKAEKLLSYDDLPIPEIIQKRGITMYRFYISLVTGAVINETDLIKFKLILNRYIVNMLNKGQIYGVIKPFTTDGKFPTIIIDDVDYTDINLFIDVFVVNSQNEYEYALQRVFEEKAMPDDFDEELFDE